jgi:hypothetical protein
MHGLPWQIAGSLTIRSRSCSCVMRHVPSCETADASIVSRGHCHAEHRERVCSRHDGDFGHALRGRWSQIWAHGFPGAANPSKNRTFQALRGLPWAQGVAGSIQCPATFRVPVPPGSSGQLRITQFARGFAWQTDPARVELSKQIQANAIANRRGVPWSMLAPLAAIPVEVVLGYARRTGRRMRRGQTLRGPEPGQRGAIQDDAHTRAVRRVSPPRRHASAILRYPRFPVAL